jgi:predicted alpha/beta-fold hydrolase
VVALICWNAAFAGNHKSKIAEAVTTLSAVEGGDDRFQLLNDLPVDAPELDLLHTSAVAADLGRLIVGSRDNTPFVVAIDGRWGAGKSTLMQQLSAELRAYGDFEVVCWSACSNSSWPGWTATSCADRSAG